MNANNLKQNWTMQFLDLIKQSLMPVGWFLREGKNRNSLN